MKKAKDSINQKNLGKILYQFNHQFQKSFHCDRINAFRFPNNIEDLFNQQQNNHYYFIEVQVYDLFKYIKTEILQSSLSKIKQFTDNLRDVYDQLQKFCKSLGLSSIYELFDKLKISMLCLIFHLIQTIKLKDTKNVRQTQKVYASMGIQMLQNKTSIDNNLHNIKKQFRLGGISLYNENYLNHIERGQAFLSLVDSVEEQHKKKWEQVWKIKNISQQKDQNNLIEVSQLRTEIFRNNNINQANIFYHESNQDSGLNNNDYFRNSNNFERAYKIDKNNSINAVSKLLKQTQRLHLQQKTKLQNIIEAKQTEIKRLVQLRQKYNKKISVQIQTDPDPQIQQLKYELQLRNNKIINLENSNMDLIQFLKKAKIQILNLQRNEKNYLRHMDKMKKQILAKNKNIRQIQKKVNILKSISNFSFKNINPIQEKSLLEPSIRQQQEKSKSIVDEIQSKNFEGSIQCQNSQKFTQQFIKSEKSMNLHHKKRNKVLFVKSVHKINDIDQQQKYVYSGYKSEKIVPRSIHWSINIKMNQKQESQIECLQGSQLGQQTKNKVNAQKQKNTINENDLKQKLRGKIRKKQVKSHQPKKINTNQNKNLSHKNMISNLKLISEKKDKKVYVSNSNSPVHKNSAIKQNLKVSQQNIKPRKYLINSRNKSSNLLKKIGNIKSNNKTTHQTTIPTQNVYSSLYQSQKPIQYSKVNLKYNFDNQNTKILIHNQPTFQKFM